MPSRGLKISGAIFLAGLGLVYHLALLHSGIRVVSSETTFHSLPFATEPFHRTIDCRRESCESIDGLRLQSWNGTHLTSRADFVDRLQASANGQFVFIGALAKDGSNAFLQLRVRQMNPVLDKETYRVFIFLFGFLIWPAVCGLLAIMTLLRRPQSARNWLCAMTLFSMAQTASMVELSKIWHGPARLAGHAWEGFFVAAIPLWMSLLMLYFPNTRLSEAMTRELTYVAIAICAPFVLLFVYGGVAEWIHYEWTGWMENWATNVVSVWQQAILFSLTGAFLAGVFGKSSRWLLPDTTRFRLVRTAWVISILGLGLQTTCLPLLTDGLGPINLRVTGFKAIPLWLLTLTLPIGMAYAAIAANPAWPRSRKDHEAEAAAAEFDPGPHRDDPVTLGEYLTATTERIANCRAIAFYMLEGEHLEVKWSKPGNALPARYAATKPPKHAAPLIWISYPETTQPAQALLGLIADVSVKAIDAVTIERLTRITSTMFEAFREESK